MSIELRTTACTGIFTALNYFRKKMNSESERSTTSSHAYAQVYDSENPGHHGYHLVSFSLSAMPM